MSKEEPSLGDLVQLNQYVLLMDSIPFYAYWTTACKPTGMGFIAYLANPFRWVSDFIGLFAATLSNILSIGTKKGMPSSLSRQILKGVVWGVAFLIQNVLLPPLLAIDRIQWLITQCLSPASEIESFQTAYSWKVLLHTTLLTKNNTHLLAWVLNPFAWLNDMVVIIRNVFLKFFGNPPSKDNQPKGFVAQCKHGVSLGIRAFILTVSYLIRVPLSIPTTLLDTTYRIVFYVHDTIFFTPSRTLKRCKSANSHNKHRSHSRNDATESPTEAQNKNDPYYQDMDALYKKLSELPYSNSTTQVCTMLNQLYENCRQRALTSDEIKQLAVCKHSIERCSRDGEPLNVQQPLFPS